MPALSHLEAPPRSASTPQTRDALLELPIPASSDALLTPFLSGRARNSAERVNMPGTVAEPNWTFRMP